MRWRFWEKARRPLRAEPEVWRATITVVLSEPPSRINIVSDEEVAAAVRRSYEAFLGGDPGHGAYRHLHVDGATIDLAAVAAIVTISERPN